MNGFPSPTHSVGARVGLTAGSGSTRIIAGRPWRMYSATLVIWSVCIDDGSATTIASMSGGIGNSALTSTTSYCFRSSFTTDHCGNCWLPAKFWPPKIFTIVSTTPTRRRSAPATTRMVRTTSYSVGSPRSKNGMTCCSAPDVNATPMKTSTISERPPATSRIWRGPMPNFSRARIAASLNGSVSSMSTSTLGPARASISSRVLIRFDRACTNSSGTIGLRNAWMNTGRSSGSASRSCRVSSLTDESCSAVTSSRTAARAASMLTAARATATATTRIAWCAHIGNPSGSRGQCRRPAINVFR